MAKLITLIIIIACFYILFNSSWLQSMQRGRRKRLVAKGKPTMFDVRDLILKGEKDSAIQLYCELFRTSRSEATKAVNELEKSIQGKSSEFE